jgi:hypothetical protein
MPEWICWLFTRHAQRVRWERYDLDVKGTTCFCTKVQRVDDLDMTSTDYGETWMSTKERK